MKYKIALAKSDKSKPQIFETVQGEGSFAGTPAFFIRLQGCNVNCAFCDEKATWQSKPGDYIEMDSAEIIKELESMNNKLKKAVITGGEPTEQYLKPLFESLMQAGFAVHLETAATGKYTDALFEKYEIPLWVTFSPKEIHAKDLESGKADAGIWQYCSEIKFVVSSEQSIEYIQETIYPQMQNRACRIYLVPDWFNFDENKKRILDLCSEHPDRYYVGIQAHKYLGID